MLYNEPDQGHYDSRDRKKNNYDDIYNVHQVFLYKADDLVKNAYYGIPDHFEKTG